MAEPHTPSRSRGVRHAARIRHRRAALGTTGGGTTQTQDPLARLSSHFQPWAPPSPPSYRSMLVRKAEMLQIECIVRGYITGSVWKEYKSSGTMHGASLPAGLQESSKLPEPVFTPSTKAAAGHDENISFEAACDIVGADLAKEARELSLAAYERGAALAAERDPHRRHQVRARDDRRPPLAVRRGADAHDQGSREPRRLDWEGRATARSGRRACRVARRRPALRTSRPSRCRAVARCGTRRRRPSPRGPGRSSGREAAGRPASVQPGPAATGTRPRPCSNRRPRPGRLRVAGRHSDRRCWPAPSGWRQGRRRGRRGTGTQAPCGTRLTPRCSRRGWSGACHQEHGAEDGEGRDDAGVATAPRSSFRAHACQLSRVDELPARHYPRGRIGSRYVL